MKSADFIKITDEEISELAIPFTYSVNWVKAGEELISEKYKINSTIINL